MDSNMKKTADRLETLSFKRLCRDTVRHAVKFQAEADNKSSAYLPFRMLYGNQFLDTLYENPEECFLEENTAAATYTDCVNFIFNPHMTKITYPLNMDFKEETASVISTNCKELRLLKIASKDLTASFFVDFLRCMSNLVVLNLSECFFQAVPVMSAIVDSLLHLQVLSLKRTNTDDDGLIVLCGHRSDCYSSTSVCSFVKNCHANCNLKLLSLELDNTEISKVGLACILTHIPTLKNISVNHFKNNTLKLAAVIQNINEQRKAFGMADFQFQLEALNCIVDSFEELKASLAACSRLKDLLVSFLDFRPQEIETAGQILGESKLNSIREMSIMCRSLDEICTESFARFWTSRGPQLASLCVVNYVDGDGYHAGSNVNVVRDILASCSALRILMLHNLFLTRPNASDSLFKDFPKLEYLVELSLEFRGDTDLVNEAARKIILSAHKLRKLFLIFSVKENIIFPCLSYQYLPHLTDVIVKEKQTAENLSGFLRGGKRAVEISSMQYT